MKNSKLFYISLLILPWLTVPFLGKSSFKKFLPAALFMVTFTKALDLLGEKKKWWRFYKGLPALDSITIFNFGPYFVTCLWILKAFYGKFRLYLIFSFILHICFTYLGGVKFFHHFKIGSLIKLKKIQLLAIYSLRSLLLYAFQFINNRLC
jgi:hypothetical protein